MFGTRSKAMSRKVEAGFGLGLLAFTFAQLMSLEVSARDFSRLDLGADDFSILVHDVLGQGWFERAIDDPPPLTALEPVDQAVLMLDSERSPQWLGFGLRNTTDQTLVRVLSLSTGRLSNFGVVTVHEDGRRQVLDYYKANETNEQYLLESSVYSALVTLEPFENRDILIRVEAAVPVQVKVRMTSTLGHLVDQQTATMLLGLYIGVMLLMTFYHVVSYLLTRKISHLFITGYVIALVVLFALERGVVNGILGASVIAVWWMPVSIILLSGCLTGFSWTFLEVGQASRGIKFSLLVPLLLTVLVSFVTVVLPGDSLHNWVYALSYINGTAILCVSFILWRRGQKEAAWIFSTRVLVQVGAVVATLARYGLVMGGYFVDHAVWLAIGAEAIVLSLLLPYRYRFLSAERDSMTKLLGEEVARYQEVVGQNDALRNGLEELLDSRREQGSALEALQQKRMQRQDALRDANQQLAQIDRRVSLGRLVAGVAHDMANPATHIAGSERIVRSAIDSLTAISRRDDVMAESLVAIRTQSELIEEKGLEIVAVNKALTRYSRNTEESVTTTLSELMESIELILKGRLKGTKLDVHVTDAPRAVSRRGQLAQVVVNLLQNAIDAVEKRPLGERYISVIAQETDPRAGERGIEIRIEDSGGGVPEYLARNIFRPFVTGGHPGHRMGLGLSTAERILTVRGGSIRVASSVKLRGASFVVVLPLLERYP